MERCLGEIATIGAELLAGNPDVQGKVGAANSILNHTVKAIETANLEARLAGNMLVSVTRSSSPETHADRLHCGSLRSREVRIPIPPAVVAPIRG